jgi:hypothetical protein
MSISGVPRRGGVGALGALGLGLVVSGCVPLLLPPVRVDGSMGARFGVHDPTSSTASPAPTRRVASTSPPATSQPLATIERVSAGFHLADIVSPERVLVDVGAGYVFNDVGWGDRKIHGLYADFSPVITRQPWWWMYFTLRGEAMFPDGRASGMGYSFFSRLGFETFTFTDGAAGAGAGSGGFAAGAAYGTIAIGGFVEAGAQLLPGGQQAGVALAGLSVRLPATIGVFCCLLPK